MEKYNYEFEHRQHENLDAYYSPITQEANS